MGATKTSHHVQYSDFTRIFIQIHTDSYICCIHVYVYIHFNIYIYYTYTLHTFCACVNMCSYLDTHIHTSMLPTYTQFSDIKKATSGVPTSESRCHSESRCFEKHRDAHSRHVLAIYCIHIKMLDRLSYHTISVHIVSFHIIYHTSGR